MNLFAYSISQKRGYIKQEGEKGDEKSEEKD